MARKLTSMVGLMMLSAPLISFAGQDGPGCGLGQMVWKGKTGLSAHSSAATTNGTFSSQLFGLTSGTLGCDPDNAVVQNDFEKKQFVAANIDSLAQDVAQGGGAHLQSLASLMGIEEQDHSLFFATTQANYDNIFTQHSSDYKAVIAAIDTAMSLNPQLKHYVQ